MQYNHQNLINVSKLTRNEVVPFYKDLILMDAADPFGDEAIRINNLILSKWTSAGLIYIKEKAWKELEN